MHLTWTHLDRIKALVEAAKPEPGSYLTISAVLEGGGERAVDRLDREQGDDPLAWVRRTLDRHRTSEGLAKCRVRLWGLGGRPLGGITTRWSGEQAKSQVVAVHVPPTTAPASTPPAPCPRCTALGEEVERLRAQVQVARGEVEAARLDARRQQARGEQAEQEARRLREDLRRSEEQSTSLLAKVRALRAERDQAKATVEAQADKIAELNGYVRQLMAQAVGELEMTPAWMLR